MKNYFISVLCFIAGVFIVDIYVGITWIASAILFILAYCFGIDFIEKQVEREFTWENLIIFPISVPVLIIFVIPGIVLVVVCGRIIYSWVKLLVDLFLSSFDN